MKSPQPTKSYQQRLIDCLTHTEQLHAQAQEAQAQEERTQGNQWSQFETALDARNQELEVILKLKHSAADAAEIRPILEQIKATDQRLMALVAEHKEWVFQQLKKRNQGNQMKAAYNQTKRPF